MTKLYTLHLPSLSACGEYITTTKRTWAQSQSEGASGDVSWDLGASMADVLRYARDGWQDGASRLATGLKMVTPRHAMPTKRYGVYGSRPSPVRFASGNPACMVQKRPQDKPKPALVIAVQIGANAAAQAEYMSNYGLALTAYIKKLALMGFPIELIAADVYCRGAARLVTSWTVKRMGQPINLADMAFSIGHPAAMRRLSFAMAERSDCPEMFGYGSAAGCVPTDFPAKRNVIILNGMLTVNTHCRTPQDAMAHVKEAIDAALAGINIDVDAAA